MFTGKIINGRNGVRIRIRIKSMRRIRVRIRIRIILGGRESVGVACS